MSEIYVSVDLETSGPTAGVNSILALGAAAFVPPSVKLTDSFYANLLPLPRTEPDPKTMKWWSQQSPTVWMAMQQDRWEPNRAFKEFEKWLSGLGGRPVFVSYPGDFDFKFVDYYFRTLRGHNPFGISGLSLKTLAMAITLLPYRDCIKAAMPVEWFKDTPVHTHYALDDAVEQGMLFVRMWNRLNGEQL